MKWILYIGIWMASATAYAQADSACLQRYVWMTGVRDTLPDWIAGPQGNGRFIGVSDPGLKPGIARQQALLRAWMLCLLNGEVRIAMVKDYYWQNKIHFGYELSADKLVALLTVEPVIRPVNFRKGREWVSQYGECFAEFWVEDGKSGDCNSRALSGKNAGIKGEMLLASNGTLQEKQEFRLDWKATCPEVDSAGECDFLLRGNREYRTLSRTIDGFRLPLMERGRYWYYDTDSTLEIAASSCCLDDAFWCAQTESLLYALIAHDFPDVALRNLEEDAGKKREALRRELIKGRVRLAVENISIRDNRLYVAWQVEDMLRAE